MPRTDRFRTIYDLVTNTLEDYVRDAVRQRQMVAPDEAWFRDLIAGFLTEYEKWPNYGPGNDIADYLDILEDPDVHRDLRLAGHVFLHIAYDLPRVIADNFKRHAASRNRGRELFLRPAPRLLRVLLQYASRGHLGLPGRFFGRFDAIRVLGYWVIALRSVAWLHAESLADAPNRPLLESRMAGAIRNAAIEATKHRWVLGVPELDNSELLTVAPPIVVTVSLGTTIGIGITSAFIAAALTALFFRRRRRDGYDVAAAIEVFGALILRNVTKALDPEISVERLKRESELRKPVE